MTCEADLGQRENAKDVIARSEATKQSRKNLNLIFSYERKDKMTRQKNFLFALVVTAILFTCEKVPDYCGKGERYDPSCQFCFAGKAFNQCGGSSYNPLTEGCIQGVEVGTLCANGSVVKLGSPCGGYTLTTTATPEFGGYVTRTPDTTNYVAGQQVILTASPEEGYTFVGWVGTEASKTSTVTIKMDGMNANKPVVAMFKVLTPGVLIATAFPENGGVITRSPYAEIYDIGERVTVTATAAAGYKFVRWSGEAVSENTSVTITMDESKTLVAMFTPIVRTLTVNANPVEGGTIFVNGTAMAGTMTQDFGTEINVRAKAAYGYIFTGWSGTATFEDANNPTTTISLGANTTITANFKRQSGMGSSGTLVDSRDGQKYKTIAIGDQTWMAENLNYNTADGVSSWCYDNAPENCAKYGRLYTWTTAMGIIDTLYNDIYWGGSIEVKQHKVCPSGWHLPSIEEWKALIAAAGGEYVAGTRLKATSGWGDGYYCHECVFSMGTDDYGFSALPGGERYYDGGDFGFVGAIGNWWMNSEGRSVADLLQLYFDTERIIINDYNKAFGASVRCVLGETPTPTYALTVSSIATRNDYAIGATGGGNYAVGTTVTITAGTAPSGQPFKTWTSIGSVHFANANNATTTFTMPSREVTVTAFFAYSNVRLGTFMDIRDGQTYGTVEIGNQTWMAENLNYQTIGSRCFGNNKSNCDKYGRLYDWATAMDIDIFYNNNEWGGDDVKHRGICPSGWHLPSLQELQILTEYVSGNTQLVGTKLKSTSGWKIDSNGSDIYGFSALPGGGGMYDTGLGSDGSWWTATAYSNDRNNIAYRLNIHGSNYSGEVLAFATKGSVFSVRCVVDNVR
jgi:uncharacterized protein (TIGR02145 family)/uncharacterized repeat protein (TIGR02543 family)